MHDALHVHHSYSGFGSLKALSEVISQPNGDQACEELTGCYYSIIPHVFKGRRPIAINTIEQIKKELELVDALGDMQVASKLISSSIPKDANGNLVNPLDAHFRSMNLATTEPIAHESKEFRSLQGYARDTRVLQAFRVERYVTSVLS